MDDYGDVTNACPFVALAHLPNSLATVQRHNGIDHSRRTQLAGRVRDAVRVAEEVAQEVEAGIVHQARVGRRQRVGGRQR
jgi:hypothetical protein